VAGDLTDAQVIHDELEQRRVITSAEIEMALQNLSAEDQVIIRLRYFDGLSVADVARTLHVDQKPLYRRIDATLQQLRAWLEQRGVNRELVAAFLAE
jgi:RNA polymerase sigma factor for flagellar operon FliA